jgi:hypothetical protein
MSYVTGYPKSTLELAHSGNINLMHKMKITQDTFNGTKVLVHMYEVSSSCKSNLVSSGNVSIKTKKSV